MKVLLAAGVIWEILVVAVCIALLVTHPLDRLLPYWAVS